MAISDLFNNSNSTTFGSGGITKSYASVTGKKPGFSPLQRAVSGEGIASLGNTFQGATTAARPAAGRTGAMPPGSQPGGIQAVMAPSMEQQAARATTTGAAKPSQDTSAQGGGATVTVDPEGGVQVTTAARLAPSQFQTTVAQDTPTPPEETQPDGTITYSNGLPIGVWHNGQILSIARGIEVGLLDPAVYGQGGSIWKADDTDGTGGGGTGGDATETSAEIDPSNPLYDPAFLQGLSEVERRSQISIDRGMTEIARQYDAYRERQNQMGGRGFASAYRQQSQMLDRDQLKAMSDFRESEEYALSTATAEYIFDYITFDRQMDFEENKMYWDQILTVIEISPEIGGMLIGGVLTNLIESGTIWTTEEEKQRARQQIPGIVATIYLNDHDYPDGTTEEQVRSDLMNTISPWVEDGTITQAQADEIVTGLTQQWVTGQEIEKTGKTKSIAPAEYLGNIGVASGDASRIISQAARIAKNYDLSNDTEFDEAVEQLAKWMDKDPNDDAKGTSGGPENNAWALPRGGDKMAWYRQVARNVLKGIRDHS